MQSSSGASGGAEDDDGASEAPTGSSRFFDEELAELPMHADGRVDDDELDTQRPPPTDATREAGAHEADATEAGAREADATEAPSPEVAAGAPTASLPSFRDESDDDDETLVRVLHALDEEDATLDNDDNDNDDATPAQGIAALADITRPGAHKRRSRPDGGTDHLDGARATASMPRRRKTTTRRDGQDDDRVPSSPPPVRSLAGRSIADGKYAIESLIGSGAAGAVYRATHRDLRRTVAVKVLHPHYQEDPHFMKSFRDEALAASQLDHPNVMRVLDFGQEPDGLVYIVMEHLSGRTLQSLLDEERRLAPERAVDIMVQVCAALSVAHDHGIVHRDIKPDNIMLAPSRNDEGQTFELVKVCDFGIAALDHARDGDTEGTSEDDFIAGTPEYMPPEQARGLEVDARSDVYACGICLYELVTGRPPFVGDSAAEILLKQLEASPAPPSQLVQGFDSLLEEIILRAIQKEPAKRQQSARELRVELKELIDPTNDDDSGQDEERSIVENVPVLDDPASGFPGFFIALASSILRYGRFERGHPEAAMASKDLARATRKVLRGRRELTFARRDGQRNIGFCVVTGQAEISDLKRLLGSQIYGSFAHPFITALVERGVAALTLREGLGEGELSALIELLLGPLTKDDLKKEILARGLRSVSTVFVSDVIGRDRRLAWKVGLCASRLARDLRALSTVRGISLKKMRESRDDLLVGTAQQLTRGDEARQFLFNADLVDTAVENLRGFSGFKVAPLIIDRLAQATCVEVVSLLLVDVDAGQIERTILDGYVHAFAGRLLAERSPEADGVLADLSRRKLVSEDTLPRDLREQMRASALADALTRDTTHFLRALDDVVDPSDYAREVESLDGAMAELARRAEATALLSVIGALARHAKGTGDKQGPREALALRAMKSMIDTGRLLPVADALLAGTPRGAMRDAARKLLVLAGSAGARALLKAREEQHHPTARPAFVQAFRETGAAGWGILGTSLPAMEVSTERDIALAEDLLRTVPAHADAALGEAVARFLSHPRLRAAAVAVIGPLLGERARKPLVDALEFAEEPVRILAMHELRRIGAVDESVVEIVERLLTMRGSASEELRAAAAAALADATPAARARAVALLVRAVEGKRGLVAMFRSDGDDESVAVTEAMARALLTLDRTTGVRTIRSRLSRTDGIVHARLSAILRGR